MCPSNLTWLLKISVKLSIFIHRNSSYKWALIFTKGWCVSFLHKVVAHLCNLFIIQIRCRNPWIVVLLQKKVTTQKLWRGNGRLRKTTKNKYSLQHYGTTEGSPEVSSTKKSLNKYEFSTKNEKRPSPGYSSISL